MGGIAYEGQKEGPGLRPRVGGGRKTKLNPLKFALPKIEKEVYISNQK